MKYLLKFLEIAKNTIDNTIINYGDIQERKWQKKPIFISRLQFWEIFNMVNNRLYN